MTATLPITTAEQLLKAGDIGRCELVQGELIMMSPAGREHGLIAARVLIRLGVYVEDRRLGAVFAAETGFRLGRNPDTVRAPDVAFVRAERVPLSGGAGFFEGPPDLVVEVLSPDDSASRVLDKVDDWLRGGVLAVWIVDPPHATVTVYTSEGTVRTLRGDDRLSGGSVLPGFDMRVGDLFDAAK